MGNECRQNLVPLPYNPRLKEAHLWRGEYEEAAARSVNGLLGSIIHPIDTKYTWDVHQCGDMDTQSSGYSQIDTNCI